MERKIQAQSRYALHISISIIILTIAVAIAVTLMFRDGEKIRLAVPGIGAFALVGIVGVFLSLTRRITAVTTFFMAAVNLNMLGMALFYQGTIILLSGFFIAFNVFTVSLLISKNRERNILLVLGFNLVVILFDLLGPSTRLESDPRLDTILISITILSLLTLFVYALKNFRFFTIRLKILTSILMVSVFSVIVISTSINLASRRSILQEVGNNLNEVASRESIAFGELLLQEVQIIQSVALSNQLRQTAVSANQSLESLSNETDVLAQLDALEAQWQSSAENEAFVIDTIENDSASYLKQIQAAFPEHGEIVATNKFGGLIAATHKTSDYYQADEQWWQQAYNNGAGALYIGDPDFDESIGAFAIDIAVPIYAADSAAVSNGAERSLAGVLKTTLNLDHINTLLGQTFTNPTVLEVQFFLGNNLQIAFEADEGFHIEPARHGLEALVERFTVDQNLSQMVDMVDHDSDRLVPSIVSLSRVSTHERIPAIEALNWYVIVSQSEEEILTAVSEQSQSTIFLSLIALLFSVVAAVLLGRSLTRPIVNLTKTAQKIEAGDQLVHAAVESRDEVGQLAAAINKMTDELRTVQNQLEVRVASRTRALQIASEVSRELSSILDPNQLIPSIVNKVRDAYDYYHTQIYLMSQDQTVLHLRGGSGHIGDQLVAKTHQLKIGQGLVGRAAETKLPVFVPDVFQEKSWLPNDLLPATVSEVAVPIIVNNVVIGVLDIQESQHGKLSIEDVETLQLIASQIGIAIQNAESFAAAKTKASQDTIILEINRQIQSTTSVESAMQVAVREIGKRLGSKTKITLGQTGTKSGSIKNGEQEGRP